MIKPEDFYSKNEYPGSELQNQIWKNIKGSIPREVKGKLFHFDMKSFAFGFGAAFTAIFVVIGIYTVFSKFVQKDEPAFVKINNAYAKAIDEFEETMPQFVTASAKKSGDNSFSLDDFINNKKAKLNNINEGILEIRSDQKGGDYSPIKQKRLWELYKMKLEILSRMIGMEENGQ